MNLEELRLDCSIKQKKGLHFILASIIIWCAVWVIHLTSLPILIKNLFTFCCTAPLMPLAYMISKAIKVDFTNKENPLTNLGVLFSLNQMLYLLIAMWIYQEVPEKMLMVLAMIFGAHLMPYGWLYKSKTYISMSVFIPIVVLIIGLNFKPYIIAAIMILFEIVLSLLLMVEIKKLTNVINHIS
ncbi:hypothetical protein FDC22_12850 [Clostridium botulinum]|uniref:Putative membrane protein n=1 Tax=Clostridium botulinum (strain Okra / Type B1) TaxID=498213 RepID=B1IHS9_CLOBK|nr:hypothetical protein [Clostridium botulinum]ACA45169.1 putative membrane protein [Clostridium botulinum B1 str. Okra]MBD5562491.1 hypothetical protein [Clostridium botulinum]MBD5565462.1 hypothetical protein [Clostridium botulinum]MBD5570020.1 hypothetical protein [Clostridium botulinum]MBD5573184.1 hypothetical protein [Clostridium botulinum]